MRKFYYLITLFALHLNHNAQVFSLLKDINPGASESIYGPIMTEQWAWTSNTLFFRADNGINGIELWKTDGTPEGTVMIKDIRPGSSGSGVINITDLNGTIYFEGYDGVNGWELWKTDGTEAGTIMIKNINPSGDGLSGQGEEFMYMNGFVYFYGNNGVNGLELWKTDGTAAGTVMVKDITSGSNGSSGGGFQKRLVINNTLYFVADNGVNGAELWKTDGSVVGTALVKDIFPGSETSNINRLFNLGGGLYFTANDGVHGMELWKSDGTAAGTVIVKDIFPGPASGSPPSGTGMAVANGFIIMTANDGSNGVELWRSDGTEAGTEVIKEIYPGPTSSSPSISSSAWGMFEKYAIMNDGSILFIATDPVNGRAI